MPTKAGSCAPKGTVITSKGTHSTVYKSRLGDKLVAVKEYILPQLPSNADEAMEVRRGALGELFQEAEAILCNPNALPRHPNIASFLGVEFQEGSGGNLDRLLITQEWVDCEANKGKPTAHPEDEVRGWIRGVLNGLNHLHSCDVSHDDMRPRNLLLSTQWERRGEGSNLWPVLTDHRICKCLRRILDPNNAATTLQQANYCPPEIFTDGKEYDPFKCDLWGVGVVALELLSGKKPWSELDPSGKGNIIFRVLQSRNPPAYPPQTSDNAKSFLDLCFARNPDDRPDIDALLAHAWLA